MNTLPLFISYLQALLTPAIAIGVGVIAFLQWRTAHAKVVLDLFDRRLRILDEVTAGISAYLGGDQLDNTREIRFRLYRAWHEARFLFGPEVADEIQRLRDDVQRLVLLQRKMTKPHPIEKGQKAVSDEAIEIDDRLSKGVARLPEFFSPYLSMRQKRVRTPREWFHDRNDIRLSYGDHPESGD